MPNLEKKFQAIGTPNWYDPAANPLATDRSPTSTPFASALKGNFSMTF